MSKLAAAGLVSTERASRHIVYRAAYEQMNALLGYLTENCCQGAGCGVEAGTDAAASCC